MPERRFLRVARVDVAGLRVDGGRLESGHGLRIGFTIERTLKKTPNTASVSIYNLNAAHRQALQELNGSDVPVVIQAGYRSESTIHTLFQGDLRHVYSEPDGRGTWVTTISSGDGENASRTGRTKRTAVAGISYQRIAQDIAADLKVGVGNLVQALKQGASISDLGTSFVDGFAAEGNTAKRLQALLEASGRQFSIQDNEIQVLKKGGVDHTGLAAELSPGAGGLVGIPVIDHKGRCSFRSLLRPELVPGGAARIEGSKIANGDWRLDTVTHIGDTHGHDNVSECEGVALGK